MFHSFSWVWIASSVFWVPSWHFFWQAIPFRQFIPAFCLFQNHILLILRGDISSSKNPPFLVGSMALWPSFHVSIFWHPNSNLFIFPATKGALKISRNGSFTAVLERMPSRRVNLESRDTCGILTWEQVVAESANLKWKNGDFGHSNSKSNNMCMSQVV